VKEKLTMNFEYLLNDASLITTVILNSVAVGGFVLGYMKKNSPEIETNNI